LNDTLVELGKRPELGFFWKQNTGGARAMNDPDTIITYGLPGSHDITGLINNGHATRAEIEIKTGTGSLSESQKTFRFRFTSYQGHFVFTVHAKNPSENMAVIEGLISEIQSFIERTKCKMS